jgi:hypothetical protein
MSAWLREQVEKLCSRSSEYALAYSHPGGHRTSNMLDRVMRAMNRYFDDGQHLHGGAEACARHCRAWAPLYNFRPWNPATARANDGWRSPAERLNVHRYHDDWLQNLLISASLGGFRPPQTPGRSGKLRKQMGDLWPYPKIDPPWDWYWGLCESD